MTTDPEMAETLDSFRGRAVMASEASVGSSFDTPIGDSLDLAASGEPRVALENFLSNLYEFDVAISAQEYDTLAALARRLQVPEAQWTFIEELRT